MRAIEIAVFLILLQASIGFVSGMGIFEPDLYVESNQFTEWGIDNFDDEFAPGSQSSLTASIELLIQSVGMIASMMLAVLIIYPLLVGTFFVPATVAALIQVGIYAVYLLGGIEFMSGRSLW